MQTIKYISPIDPHVHLRGEEKNRLILREDYTKEQLERFDENPTTFYHKGKPLGRTYSPAEVQKAEGEIDTRKYAVIRNPFIRMALQDAKAVGIAALYEMPNPKINGRYLTDVESFVRRMNLVTAKQPTFLHGINLGLTDDPEQVRTVLQFIQESKANTIRARHIGGDKTFYVHSTGNMGILNEEVQRRLWQIKSELGYTGVSQGHFEDEKSFTEQFDPKNPITHSLRQNPRSELIQIERQIKNAKDAGFRGIFYIAHISNPDSIEYILKERKNLPFEVVIEMTGHHAFLNTDDYAEFGNELKMNPPVRSPKMQARNLDHLLAGNIDVIATDHAPHYLDEKLSDNPMSGIPALHAWPLVIAALRKHGMKDERLDNLIFYNTQKLLQTPVEPKIVEVKLDVHLGDKYGYDPLGKTLAKELAL